MQNANTILHLPRKELWLIFLTPGTNKLVFFTNCSVRLDQSSLNEQYKDPMTQKGNQAAKHQLWAEERENTIKMRSQRLLQALQTDSSKNLLARTCGVFRVKLYPQIHYFGKLHLISSGKPKANDLVKGTGSTSPVPTRLSPRPVQHSPAGWKVWTEGSSSCRLALYWKPWREQMMPGTQMSLEITPETSRNDKNK